MSTEKTVYAKSQIKKLLLEGLDARIKGNALDFFLNEIEIISKDLAKKIIELTFDNKRKTVSESDVSEVCNREQIPKNSGDKVISIASLEKILRSQSPEETKIQISKSGKEIFGSYIEGLVSKIGKEAYEIAMRDKERKTISIDDLMTITGRYPCIMEQRPQLVEVLEKIIS